MNNLYVSILGASLCQYFERVPVGRILNRFTKDLDVIDTELYPNLSYFYIISTLCLVDMFLLLYSSNLFIVIPILAFIYFAFRLQRFYMKVSRELFRIEAITRSPVLSYFSESISGVTTIRAYGKQLWFIHE